MTQHRYDIGMKKPIIDLAGSFSEDGFSSRVIAPEPTFSPKASKMKPFPCSFAIGLLACFVQIGRADPPSTWDLLERMPQATNAVVVVQVGQILQSQYGLRAGWDKLTKTIYLAGTIPINPSVERIAIGSQFDPQHPGQSWYVGLISMNKTVSLAKLAEAHKGKMEEIADQQVAMIQPFGCVAALKSDLLCAVSMPDHQACSRWLRFAMDPERKPAVNSYLANAAGNAAQNHILIAIDGSDLIEQSAVRLALVNSNLISDDEKLFNRVAKFVEKLRGIRMVITLDNQINVAMHFDSKEGTFKELEVLKPFVAYVLEHAGAELQDLKAAKVSMDGPTVSLRFKISDDELRGIMELMSSPIVHPNPDEFANVSLSPAGISAEATGNYYRMVNKILDDIRKRTRSATDYWKTALWHETAAKAIETTSVLRVDKQAVAYATDAIIKLHAIADSLRGVPISVDQLQSRKSLYVIGMPFWWGGYSIRTNIPEIEAKQQDVIAKDAANRDKLWQDLDTARSVLRRELAEKYHVDMDSAPK
jgi:hypothetical protein